MMTEQLDRPLEDPSRSLVWRRKGQHLSEEQQSWIRSQILNDKLSTEEICQAYEISQSTIARILKDCDTPISNQRKSARLKYYEWLHSSLIIYSVSSYLVDTTTALFVIDIQKHLRIEWKILIPAHFIRRLLKEHFGLSYKKASSWPLSIDMTKQKWSKTLFAVKVVNLLPKIRLILNMDEVCLTKNLKQQYSWIERGQSKWIRNSQFTDMIAIICTIFSWGIYFNGFFLTINGELVKNYIENLISFISKRVDAKLSEVLLVLDNWPKHKWKQVSKFLREWGMNIVFLPGYTPELAPIEIMFRNLKSRVRSSKEKG